MPKWSTVELHEKKMLPDSASLPVDQRANPFVFVVGCPRSGTTLLQRMLDSHPQLTVANDTHFITRAAKTVLRDDPNPSLSPELVSAVKNYRRIYRLGLDENAIDLAAENCRTYAEFISYLYALRGQMKMKPLSGEKTPDYCRQMPVLRTLFPDSRFVHIIRDGRNTALSTLNWASDSKGPGKWSLWNEDPVGTCALWWHWQAGTGQRDGGAIGSDHYLQVRYEDLVAQPESTLEEISGFLGIPYSEAMANYYVGKVRHGSGLSAKSAWLPPVQNLRDWRKSMSTQDIDVFEGIAGQLLQKNGYDYLGNTPDNAASDRIRRCLEWWNNTGRR